MVRVYLIVLAPKEKWVGALGNFIEQSTTFQLEACRVAFEKRLHLGAGDWVVTLKTLALWHKLLDISKPAFGRESYRGLAALEGAAYFLDKRGEGAITTGTQKKKKNELFFDQ